MSSSCWVLNRQYYYANKRLLLYLINLNVENAVARSAEINTRGGQVKSPIDDAIIAGNFLKGQINYLKNIKLKLFK